jgi:POT family proton-dependent oligopeptide transporter
MILGNLIIAFSPLHFFYLGITLTLLEQVSSSQYFFNGWELYKVGTVVEMLVLDCFIPELILSIVRRSCLCVLRNKSRLRLSYAFLSAAIVMVIGLITFNNETFLGPHR